MIEQLKKTATGAAILKDWLGDGLTPVSAEEAEARAGVCIKCPHNMSSDWWSHSIGLVAEAIRKQIGVKNDISATTKFDEQLGTCSICLCHMPLKVWCPMEHISSHTYETEVERYPGFCWIKEGLTK